jgi:GntR family transcriptional regulator
MQDHWNEDQPIYRQLRDKVVNLVLEGAFKEGEAVPSVRQIAAEYSINHLTVSKAYQELVDDGLLMKKRGVGMFVVEGARGNLLSNEKEKFLTNELPALLGRVKQLGISTQEIVDIITTLNKDAS